MCQDIRRKAVFAAHDGAPTPDPYPSFPFGLLSPLPGSIW